MRKFSRIGTDRVSIGIRLKMGSSSLHQLERDNDVIRLIHSTAETPRAKGKIIRDSFMTLDDNRICVILIRDAIDKYRSGVIEELSSWRDNTINVEEPSITLINWTNRHAKFWKWNDCNDLSLLSMSMYKGIYFLELEDLSNPKFLKWLQERDGKWNEVKEIPYKNQTNFDRIDKQDYSSIWDKYKNKFPVLNLMVKQEQESIDFIRKHKKYIKL